MWRQAYFRLRSFFRRHQQESELDEEIRFHLANETEELMAAGMYPEEARAAAQPDFGLPEGYGSLTDATLWWLPIMGRLAPGGHRPRGHRGGGHLAPRPACRAGRPPDRAPERVARRTGLPISAWRSPGPARGPCACSSQVHNIVIYWTVEEDLTLTR